MRNTSDIQYILLLSQICKKSQTETPEMNTCPLIPQSNCFLNTLNNIHFAPHDTLLKLLNPYVHTAFGSFHSFCERRPLPNTRGPGVKPRVLIIHYTATVQLSRLRGKPRDAAETLTTTSSERVACCVCELVGGASSPVGFISLRRRSCRSVVA